MSPIGRMKVSATSILRSFSSSKMPNIEKLLLVENNLGKVSVKYIDSVLQSYIAFYTMTESKSAI